MFKWLAKMIRRTSPVSQRPHMFGLSHASGMGASGERVTEYTSATVATYWACVRVLSGAMAQLPWTVQEIDEKGAVLAPNHPATRLLRYSPNPWMTPAEFKELAMQWVLSWGNAYFEVERDANNRPVNLWPIEPQRVKVLYDEAGQLFYEVNQNNYGAAQNPVYLPAADVLHFRNFGDQLYGWSPIRFAANTLGLAQAQDEAVGKQMNNGVKLSGVMTPPGNATLPAESVKQLSEDFNKANAGPQNAGKVLFLNRGFTFEAMTMSNDDAQLLESRQFTVLEICRFMGVPPTLVYDLSASTYNNNEQLGIQFVQYSLNPWVVKFEQQANRKLISANNQRKYKTELQTRGLMRGDLAARSAYYKQMFDLGVLNTDEIRQAEGHAMLEGGEGQKRFVSTNLQSLEDAGEESEPEMMQPIIPEPEDEIEVNGNGRDRRIRRN